MYPIFPNNDNIIHKNITLINYPASGQLLLLNFVCNNVAGGVLDIILNISTPDGQRSNQRSDLLDA